MLPRPLSRSLALSLAAAAAALSAPAHAAEALDVCVGTIDALPAVISTQGVWCLDKDLATSMASGTAITIGTNNVTIDCNDFRIGGLGAGAGTQTIGIAGDGRSNATIRNCKIRGFSQGIRFSGALSSGHLIEDNLIEGTTQIALNVRGDGSLIRRNRILDTGGSTVIAYEALGMFLQDDVDVIDNIVGGVFGTDLGGEAYVIGILAGGGVGSQVRGNIVRGVDFLGEGTSYGIAVGEQVDVVDNFVSGPGPNGISCEDTTSFATDNRVVLFTAPIAGCTERDNVVP